MPYEPPLILADKFCFMSYDFSYIVRRNKSEIALCSAGMLDYTGCFSQQTAGGGILVPGEMLLWSILFLNK